MTMLEPDDPRHGTTNGYGNHGCRCDRCRRANTDYHREADRRRGRRPIAEHLASLIRHGMSRYKHGCRCEVCVGAAREHKRRERRALRRRGLRSDGSRYVGTPAQRASAERSRGVPKSEWVPMVKPAKPPKPPRPPKVAKPPKPARVPYVGSPAYRALRA